MSRGARSTGTCARDEAEGAREAASRTADIASRTAELVRAATASASPARAGGAEAAGGAAEAAALSPPRAEAFARSGVLRVRGRFLSLFMCTLRRALDGEAEEANVFLRLTVERAPQRTHFEKVSF